MFGLLDKGNQIPKTFYFVAHLGIVEIEFGINN